MAFGVQTFTNTGALALDGVLGAFKIIQRGVANAPAETLTYIGFPTQSTPPQICVCPENMTPGWTYVGASCMHVDKFQLGSDGINVPYLVVRIPDAVAGTGFGMNLYNAAGGVIFSSSDDLFFVDYVGYTTDISQNGIIVPKAVPAGYKRYFLTIGGTAMVKGSGGWNYVASVIYGINDATTWVCSAIVDVATNSTTPTPKLWAISGYTRI